MELAEDFTIPPLPSVLRLGRGRRTLSVRVPGRKMIDIPVVFSRAPTSRVISLLPQATEPRVFVAPRLTRDARTALWQRGWGWIDGSGSLKVSAPGLYVEVEKPSVRLPQRGVLAISPQGERVVRHLLDNYPAEWRLTELARLTHLDKGYASRIVRRLEAHGVVEYERGRPIRVPYPVDLFELWAATPDRARGHDYFVRGSSQEVSRRLKSLLGPERVAFTGTLAADLVAPHGSVQRVEAYVPDVGTAQEATAELRGEPAQRGSNVTLLVHRDPGVITIGAKNFRTFPVVALSQVYRDLMRRGSGRDSETAQFLRKERLKW